MTSTTDQRPSAPALTPAAQAELDAMLEYVREQEKVLIGYPCRSAFDYSALHEFLRYAVNNVGDPFAPSTYRMHTRTIEREVLGWFAELTHIPPEEYWGYVTNGGTEGNIYGLFLARELYPTGMAYYSEDTHYSVSKNLRVLNMRHIMIKSQASGELDYEDLRQTLRIHRDVPPIIFANVGTTMTEGVDDVQHIRALLQELAIPEAYIHCDAALAGMTLPFLPNAPIYDFRAGIDSISISGHKFIGAPFPCGIVLAKRSYVSRIARSIEYVGTLDTTLTGSRNALAPLFLWYAIKTKGREGFRREAEECLANARYAEERFRAAGIPAERNCLAITVIFPRPAEAVLNKWQIAVHKGRAHIIVMPSVTRERIDALLDDILASGGAPPRGGA